MFVPTYYLVLHGILHELDVQPLIIDLKTMNWSFINLETNLKVLKEYHQDLSTVQFLSDLDSSLLAYMKSNPCWWLYSLLTATYFRVLRVSTRSTTLVASSSIFNKNFALLSNRGCEHGRDRGRDSRGSHESGGCVGDGRGSCQCDYWGHQNHKPDVVGWNTGNQARLRV